jgi:peptide/nickel transport system permease protein
MIRLGDTSTFDMNENHQAEWDPFGIKREEAGAPASQGFLQNGENGVEVKKAVSGTFWRTTKYLLARLAGISITIFIGIFITVIIANRGGQIDKSVYEETILVARQNMPAGFCFYCSHTPEEQALFDETLLKYEKAAGLKLPFFPRHLLWTIRALKLDLGRNIVIAGFGGFRYSNFRAADIILAALPRTLMLIGPAFFFLFLLGIPLALFLFRKHGGRLDRLFTVLSPVSSIPAWVMGVILILIFAAGLRLLPPSGMYDSTPAANPFASVFMVLKHMFLPILAIFLSLIFQLIYAWKTFFHLYANEDYVELARGKGLPDRWLENRYILRPTLPYILTNFALMMVSFWQIIVALEYVFNWPGIGRLYIQALPNFHGENIFPGVMPVIVGLVVMFAYLLGITFLVLDIIYALVDPRVRVGEERQTVRPVVARRRAKASFHPALRQPIPPNPGGEGSTGARRMEPARAKVSLSERFKRLGESFAPLKNTFLEIWHFPTAVFGLAVILLLVCGSIAAVTLFPYNELARIWSENVLTGKSYVPKLAKPVWVNWLRKDPLPSSIFLDSAKGTASKTIQPAGEDGIGHFTLTYTINYPYGGYPQEMDLYFSSRYVTKRPFISLNWSTPDGRELVLDNFSPSNDIPYNFSLDLSPGKFLPDYPQWLKWFVVDEFNATPDHYLLFSDPTQDKPVVLPGTYTLRIDATTYEPEADIDAELVILGQVYGWAGTDYLRRDLLVPLLWGMPFALALGLVGASLTTFFSMVVAATGVWFGGWFDNLVQRLIEGVMILPIIAIGVILYAYSNMSIWTFLALIALLNVFGSPTKSFRATLLQIKDSPYIEWARSAGMSNSRIILRYLLPNILPLLIPQLVALIPSYVFLEATLGIFGVKSDYPTWGKVIYEALKNGATYGSGYWVLEPIGLLLLTGLAFAMLGFALERILNPRLRNE